MKRRALLLAVFSPIWVPACAGGYLLALAFDFAMASPRRFTMLRAAFLLVVAVVAVGFLFSWLGRPVPSAQKHPTGRVLVEARYRGLVAAGEVRP